MRVSDSAIFITEYLRKLRAEEEVAPAALQKVLTEDPSGYFP